ncbi:MAG: hypothetical protein IJX04_00495 [Oscillospiraceae bacterium]|nr:hypothetical protein [Oscillospiraceae bacterium]
MVQELVLLSAEDILISRLRGCPPGNKDAAAYETVCSDIIDHLFRSDFRQSYRQSGTADAMFRMDLQCSLRNTTEFWQFLYEAYKCRITVFEFKNYAAPIDQNLIYTTQKYLHPKLFRTVAFIISRKGFSPHARDAARGLLMEYSKLIVDLTDEDLIAMLELKKRGGDPSDHLMRRVERMFMSISV